MTFAWPQFLWLLLLPAALLAWELTRRRRDAAAPAHPKILRAEAGERGIAFVPSAAPISARRKARPWLVAGLACTIVALARPQWGRVDEPVFDQSREILLAIDLSRSMLTPDVKPSRLERTKLLVQSLLEKLTGERVGLVVFSGTAFLQSPLSADYEILREFLPSLNPDFLPEGGTNYRALLDTALDAFNGSNSADRFLIILSDGEATDTDWQDSAEKLKAKGIRVIGLGVGTTNGAMIPDGAGGFVKDERGAVVLSKLESATLQELARTTDGAYRDASTWVDLAGLLRETVEAGRKGRFVEKNTIRLVERFQWPLALGLWCLFASLCYEFPVRPRPRDLALRLATPEKGARRREQEKTPQTAVALLLFLLSPFFLLPAPQARAAATLAPASPDTPSIARTVGRIANSTAPTSRDWAELSRETVAWGTQLQSEQQSVPEGPVRDALAAADLGAKLDPQATDWSKLREELEALLKKPEDQKQQQQQQQNQDKNQPQQKQDQQKPDQQKDNPPPPDEKKSGADQQEKQSSSNPPPPEQNQKPENQNKKSGESAFGDMKEKPEPPPPPPSDTQKVGGAPDKKDQPKENADPALAIPLQKLDQLRNQDSPARLFELMEPDKKASAPKSGKNW
ncbi:MAG TPA: VWA domain-containing protein [Opitutaceae bacterium]|nr:VWA domain-containing protein [Opitutaceae bacterium]